MKTIKLLPLMLLWSSLIFSQISGTVNDKSSNEPLSGAHIVLYYENGITIAEHAISGEDGSFKLKTSPQPDMRLVISYLGYQANELRIIENQSDIKISLQPSAVDMGEVRVSALRSDKMLKEVSIPVSVLNSEDMLKDRGFTAPEMLRNEPGVTLSGDGIWATSLNIRGLSEQRIVTLVDGNRIETATDIAAGMAMVDVNDIERIEVIKGAASSLYGTGAMGGVVNIITKDGQFSPQLNAGGSVSLVHQTVNNMSGVNASVNAGAEKWYVRLSGTYRDASNVQTPEGELENSQFSDKNLSIKAGFKPFEDHELKLNYQRYEANDVGIPGGRSFPSTATATYPEEIRDMFSTSYTIHTKGDMLKDIQLKYFHQYIVRDVELIPNPAVVVTPSGYHNTNGLQLQASLTPGKSHAITAGMDAWQRELRTEREKNINQAVKDTAGNIITVNHIVRGEIPIPETKFSSLGWFVQDEFTTLNDKLKITLGGRFDLINIRNEEAIDPDYMIINDVRNDNPPNQRITFEARDVMNQSWSANLGLLYELNENMNLTASFSRAFRSPSIEERYKYIDLGSMVNIGDPDLKPENGYFADLGFHIWANRLQVSLNAFANRMNNLIVAEPGQAIYNYSDQPDRYDTIQALINANVDEALLYGYDLSLSYSFIPGWVAFASSSFVRGIDTKNDTDLPLIPPLNGRLGLKYKHPKWFGMEVAARLVSDQLKVAEGESTTGGYATYDLRLYSRPINIGIGSMEIYTGIENITDRAFVNHLTSNRGLIKYEPGRNVYLRLKLNF